MAKNPKPGARKAKAKAAPRKPAPKPRRRPTTHFPALGQWLMFLDNPKNVDKVVYSLYAICAGLFLADFFYEKKAYVEIEYVPGFYALYGFIMCALLVICAKLMRIVLKRPEDYYAPYDVESEAYPEEGLDRESHYD